MLLLLMWWRVLADGLWWWLVVKVEEVVVVVELVSIGWDLCVSVAKTKKEKDTAMTIKTVFSSGCGSAEGWGG